MRVGGVGGVVVGGGASGVYRGYSFCFIALSGGMVKFGFA